MLRNSYNCVRSAGIKEIFSKKFLRTYYSLPCSYKYTIPSFRLCNFKFYSTAGGDNEGCPIKTQNCNPHYITNIKEVQIPMPYGNIAAKVWGRDTDYPILALHGWLDNCGTFDKLIPLLAGKYYIVALDAPGHGMSSHRPSGCFYSDIGMVIDFKKVTEHLGWKKFSIIGHSFGAGLGLTFSSIFPDLVEKLVLLDMSYPVTTVSEKVPGIITKAITDHMKIESKISKSPPLYTPETAAMRLKKGMHDEITLEGAEILNQRGTCKSKCGKGVIFSRDLRCKPIEEFSVISHEVMLQYMSAVHSELLIIMANNTHPFYQPATPEISNKVFDIYRKHTKRFFLKYVEGNHFVHLNNPERVAPLIDEFFAELSSAI